MDSGRRFTPKFPAIVLLLFLGLLVGLHPANLMAATFIGLVRVDKQLVDNTVGDIDINSSNERIAKGIRDLYGLGYFERVDVLNDDGSLTWRVKERPFVLKIERVGINELSKDDVEKLITIHTGEFLLLIALR